MTPIPATIIDAALWLCGRLVGALAIAATLCLIVGTVACGLLHAGRSHASHAEGSGDAK